MPSVSEILSAVSGAPRRIYVSFLIPCWRTASRKALLGALSQSPSLYTSALRYCFRVIAFVFFYYTHLGCVCQYVFLKQIKLLWCTPDCNDFGKVLAEGYYGIKAWAVIKKALPWQKKSHMLKYFRQPSNPKTICALVGFSCVSFTPASFSILLDAVVEGVEWYLSER